MGLRTVFTDHSLFGFADAASILTNKLLKFALSDVDHVICVSHTWFVPPFVYFPFPLPTHLLTPSACHSKENTVLRASLDPLMVSVIPNAVVAENFRPLGYPSSPPSSISSPTPGQIPPSSNPSSSLTPPRRILGPHDPITIVVISRLFYNKGTDLLTAAIPRILSSHPNTRFIIAGSGPKSIDLEQMIETNLLQDRVEMLGPIRHSEVRDVMVRGHIYLHPSLTEAFGTVIVEAASCGLYVVCTQVGGIPEVLPGHMTVFAKPEEDDLVAATGRAIGRIRRNEVRTELFHEQVRDMYSWTNVAERTERVYKGISGAISEAEFYGYDHLTRPGGAGGGGKDGSNGWAAVTATRGMRSGVQSFALIDRLKRYYGCGVWAGKLFCVCVIIDYLIFLFLELVFPREKIDICPDWPRKKKVVGDAGARGEGGGLEWGDVEDYRRRSRPSRLR